MIDLYLGTPTKAALICHGGIFHADDVFATVFLCRLINRPLSIARVQELPESCSGLVYDIGLGKYDYKQPAGVGCHKSGIPYATFGLLWSKFGKKYCSRFNTDTDLLFDTIDLYTEGIDAYTHKLHHIKIEPVINIPTLIELFNPTDIDSSDFAYDLAFLDAVTYADRLFELYLTKVLDTIKTSDTIKNSILNGMILDEYTHDTHMDLSESLRHKSFPANS